MAVRLNQFDIKNRRTAMIMIAAGATAAAATAAVARQRSPRSLPARRGDSWATIRAVTIYQAPEQVYAFWRDLPRVAAAMDPPARVVQVDDKRSEWTIDLPAGRTVTWTAEIVEQADSLDASQPRPGSAGTDERERVLAWRVDEGPVPHAGRIEFRPAANNRGTEVKVGLRYKVRGGRLGRAAAKALGNDPDQVLRTTLRRVKSLVECGEVVRVFDQPTGRGPVQERVTRVAQRRLVTGGRP
jgi:uncharacterized membrane protein